MEEITDPEETLRCTEHP